MKAELLDIETQNTDWQKIDYRPFGEQSWTATDGVVRRGFGGDIFDIESGFIRMGARLFEPETGRFTSIDPLFEAFKRWSPYTYSYNSPLTFRDPTGLAPEKEKYKDEILTILPHPIDAIIDALNLAKQVSTELGISYDEYAMYMLTLSHDSMWRKYGAGGAKTGAAGSAYGILNDKGGTLYIIKSDGSEVSFPVEFQNMEKAQEELDALVSFVNDILSVAPDYFDNLKDGKDRILLGTTEWVHKAWKENSKNDPDNAPFAFYQTNPNGRNKLYFSTDILLGKSVGKYKALIRDGKSRTGFSQKEMYLPPVMIVAHEFAHAMHYSLLAHDRYLSYHYQEREHYATKMQNRVLIALGYAPQANNYQPPVWRGYFWRNLFNRNAY